MTIAPGPRQAQSTAHQTVRRLLGRSAAWEGGFVLQPQVPSSRKSSSRHAAPASLPCCHPKGSSYHEPVPAHVQGSVWGKGRDYALSEAYCKSCGYEAFGPYQWPDALRRDLVAVIVDGHKLIRSTAGPDEIYRLTLDPAESAPVTDADPKSLRLVDEVIAERNKRLVQERRKVPTDETLLDKLKSLGYIR